MTVWRFLFISIALHLIIWTFLLKNAELNKNKDQSIEVNIVDQADQKRKAPDLKKQVVQAPKVPKELLDAKKHEAKYLGETDQSVIEETKSHLTGLTQNGSNSQGQSKVENQSRSNGKNKSPKPADEVKTSQETEIDKDGRYKPKSLTDLGQTLFSQQSMNSDSLNNVKDGLVNALNTERFTYYSFFSRVDEKIYPLAQRNFDDTVARMSAADLRKLSIKTQLTVVDVIISPRGDYIDTVVTESSGSQALDNVAINAFKEAAFFPNPPAEMVKKDGKIHLQFGFNFLVSDSAFARRSSR